MTRYDYPLLESINYSPTLRENELTPFCLISNGRDWFPSECHPLIFDGRKRRIGREKYRAKILKAS